MQYVDARSVANLLKFLANDLAEDHEVIRKSYLGDSGENVRLGEESLKSLLYAFGLSYGLALFVLAYNKIDVDACSYIEYSIESELIIEDRAVWANFNLFNLAFHDGKYSARGDLYNFMSSQTSLLALMLEGVNVYDKVSLEKSDGALFAGTLMGNMSLMTTMMDYINVPFALIAKNVRVVYKLSDGNKVSENSEAEFVELINKLKSKLK